MEPEAEPYERTIYFEGIPLPSTLVHVDHLGMYEIIADFPDDTSEWLWRFPICFGMKRTDASASVIHHCTVARRLALLHRDSVVAYLSRNFPDHKPSTVFDEWQDGFSAMLQAATGVPLCSWIAPADSHPSATKTPQELLRRLELAFRNANRANER